MRPTLLYFAVISAFQSSASAFSFFLGNTPNECGDVDLTWTGGSPPFEVLLTPVFGTPRTIEVPDSAFADGKGTFKTKLPFEKDHRYLITMSDSVGFGTGGSTPLLTPGARSGDVCNTTDAGIDFSYQLNTALQQCRPYVFSGYRDAIQPVTIMAIIPGGESFILSPPRGPTSFTWTANVRAGTTLIFVMVDAQGRQGGSSASLEVGPTDESVCLGNNSPSSTVVSITSTSSSSPSATSPTASPPSSSPSSSGGTPVGAILGTILGALIFLAVAVTLGLFFLKRRRERASPWDRRNSQRMPPQLHLGDGAGGRAPSPYHYPSPLNPHAPPTAYPFLGQPEDPFNSPLAASSSSVHLDQHDPFNPPTDSRAGTEVSPFTPVQATTSTLSAAQRKAALAGNPSYKPSRFILHTDIEDTADDDDAESVVELPPAYNARNALGAAPSVAPSERQGDRRSSPDLS